MAFTLALTTVSTNANYANVSITLDNRENFGVLSYVQMYLASEPTVGAVATNDPLTVTTWAVGTSSNARYKVTGYAYPNEANAVSSDGNYRVDSSGSLQKYASSAWADTEFDDAARTAATETSNVLDNAILSQSYLLRNKMNLKYVTQVQKDIREGTAYTNLYYKRTDLDYTDALINAAEYNWSLGLYTNFYDICKELNLIQQNYV